MKKYYWIILIIATLSTACKLSSYNNAQGEGVTKKDWKLIWEENFDLSKLDTSKWTKITPGGSDWNKHMTTDSMCYEIADGKLFLKGIINPDTKSDPRPYLTGGVYTKGKFAFQYGKIEIHAKLECAQGAWPAMWMLSENQKYGAYPRNGEIDIMEHLNFDDKIYQTTHSYYTLELKQKRKPPQHGTAKLDIDKFNTFGLEWFPDKLVFTLNGKESFRYPKVEGVDPSQWPYDQEFYVLIDQQLGGGWVGKVKADDLPVQMIVDWVKVYQKK
ncbi:MAG: beta-glucanase [Bacteroidetes bacterium]|nr:MAG: beta-glucanase [Bacteroidota bacterium]